MHQKADGGGKVAQNEQESDSPPVVQHTTKASPQVMLRVNIICDTYWLLLLSERAVVSKSLLNSVS